MQIAIIALFLLCAVSAQQDTSIYGVIESLGLKTSLSIINTAGQKKQLEKKGPYTALVPSEEAFAQFPKDFLHRLQTDASVAYQYVEYHGIDVVYNSSSLKNNQLLESDSFDQIRVNIYNVHAPHIITFNGAPVSSADHEASNGVVHVLSQVMYPIPNGNIVHVVIGEANLSTLATAVSKAGLISTLSGKGPFTVFAPTNEAFAKLPAGVLDGLLKNVTALTDVLTYHVVPDVYYDAGLYNGQMLKTVERKELTIKTAPNAPIMVNDEAKILTSLAATNGVVQVIDTVLIPPSMHFELVYNKE